MIAVAIAAGVVVLALIAFALDAINLVRDAERRCADARVDAANKSGQLAIAAADIATQKARAERAEDRANALDAELDQVATDGDAVGARDRVLRRKDRTEAGSADAAGGNGSGGVPGGGPHTAVARVDGDALAKPGE